MIREEGFFCSLNENFRWSPVGVELGGGNVSFGGGDK
jgi:hypothetical protein